MLMQLRRNHFIVTCLALLSVAADSSPLAFATSIKIREPGNKEETKIAEEEDVPGCRCAADSAAILGSLAARACTTANGARGIDLSVRERCVPLSYGATCATHDLAHDPDRCDRTNPACRRELKREWCYVADRDACMAAPAQRVYQSEHFTAAADGVDIFYSYTACDGAVDWEDLRRHTLGGATILATTPQAYFPPYHYKRNPAGDVLSKPGAEYWNKSVPFEGAMIDYLDELQDLAKGDFTIEWTFGSRASTQINPSSKYTASMQDVEDGLVDMVVGPVWETSERLRMSAYTMPIFYSRSVLIVPRPEVDGSLGKKMSKFSKPFKPNVWVVIFVIIIPFSAALSMWFSGEGQRRVSSARRAAPSRGDGGRKRRHDHAIKLRLGLDAWLRTGTAFASGGMEYDDGASLPAKLLVFGFAAFTLVVVSAYVANLAAFLTHNDYAFVMTMIKATEKGWRICALPAIKMELQVAWPDTKFVFGDGGRNWQGLIKDYDNGKCKGIVYPSTTLEMKNKLCDRDLVVTDSFALKNPVAWPIRADYAAGLSHWIYEAEMKRMITVTALKDQYEARGEQPKCDVVFVQDEEGDEYAQITLANLAGPLVLFAALALMACGLQLHAGCTKKTTRRNMLGRNPSLGLEDPGVAADQNNAASNRHDSTRGLVEFEEKRGLEEGTDNTTKEADICRELLS